MLPTTPLVHVRERLRSEDGADQLRLPRAHRHRAIEAQRPHTDTHSGTTRARTHAAEWECTTHEDHRLFARVAVTLTHADMMSAQAGAHPTTQHEHDADNQQQYHQQQQQPYPPPHPYQHSYLPPSSFSSSLPLPPPPPPASAPAAAELSSLQYAQLQQLQYQQMQWQYLQQLQQQQMYLQQHQQTAAPGQFDPLAAAPQQAAGASQYRSAYQSYGDYSQAIDPNQQQLVAVDAQGRLVPVDPYRQVAPASGVVDTTAAGAVTGRDRAPPPAVDTNGWDGAITYPSKCNTDRYLTHRKYFSNIPPVIKSVRGRRRAKDRPNKR